MEESRAKLTNYWSKTGVKVMFEQRKSTIRQLPITRAR
jgi:hypothetical protein